MAKSVLVDSGFLVALLSRQDGHHLWAKAQSVELPQPWMTCDAVLSESIHLLGRRGQPRLAEMLRRGIVRLDFDLRRELQSILKLMDKYVNVPMSLADACLVRMTEILPGPVVVTTDGDFRVYRRHSRQVVPCSMPQGVGLS